MFKRPTRCDIDVWFQWDVTSRSPQRDPNIHNARINILSLVSFVRRNAIPHGAIFWQVCMIFRWKEPYEAAGFVWQCFGSAISHLLWDVFSTMKEKRAVWNRDGWKVNINFRSQNLSVWCRLNLSTSEKSSSVELLLVCMDVFFFVCVGENPKAAGGWSNCTLFSLEGKNIHPPGGFVCVHYGDPCVH